MMLDTCIPKMILIFRVSWSFRVKKKVPFISWTISLWFSPKGNWRKKTPSQNRPRFGRRPPSLGPFDTLTVGGNGHVFRNKWCLEKVGPFSNGMCLVHQRWMGPKSDMIRKPFQEFERLNKKSQYFISIGERQFLFHEFLRSKNVNLWARRNREDGYGCPHHSWNSPGNLKTLPFCQELVYQW